MVSPIWSHVARAGMGGGGVVMIEQSDPLVLRWGASADVAECAVLSVHGRSQDPTFMRRTSERFGATGVRFYAPEAPGHSWYPQPFLEPLHRNRPALDDSLRVLERSLAQLAEAGFGPERVVLWGFSQGACLLAHHVLTSPQRFAGLVLFTGGYLGQASMPALENAPLREMPALVRSIDQDPWVPRFRVEDTARLLSGAGAAVDLRIDPGDEHVITDEACASATRLLASLRLPR